MEASEAAAIERARAGDKDAFRLLVEQHSRTVFRLAYRMTGNEEDAEDMVQETFLRAYRQIGQFNARAKFSTWLCRITTNCSLDLMRARQRRREVAELPDPQPAPDPAPDRLVFSRELQRKLAAAIGTLSAVERTAFVLRHFEGVSIDEIARVLGRRNGAARHSVFRAVQKLRRALKPVMGYEQ